MARWTLAGAGAAFWAGILLAGNGEGPPSLARAAWLLVIGAGVLVAAGFAGRGAAGILRTVAVCLAAWLAFASMGAGWWWVRSGVVRRSALARLAGSAVLLDGALSDEPE